MCTLVDRLCILLQCNKNEIVEKLQDPISHALVDADCSICKLSTNFMGCFNREIRYYGITSMAACAQNVFGGYLDITVQQYMFCRCRKTLLDPELPCVVEFHPHRDKGAYEYFPLECVDVVGLNSLYIPDESVCLDFI